MNTQLQTNSVILHDAHNQRWLHFCNPVQVLTTCCLDEVIPLLEEIQQQVNQSGYYAAGFISYEAAPAFDRCLITRPCDQFPLVWFGLYTHPQTIPLPRLTEAKPISLSWSASISQTAYQAAIHQIKTYIAQGLTYQVNFSFRLRSPFIHDPWLYFLQLINAQGNHYGAWINLNDWIICCASPELFFQLTDRTLLSRPMKGTAPRGITYESDRDLAQMLRHSAKNQAENVMIVDMIRNDMGRIAEIGSVQVNQLFTVEQYPTVWQMTSSIQSLTDASVVEILKALFPCASITGAPKPRTMQIIAELEDSPRRIYTGTIGFLAPGRMAQFNVAIRTTLIDKTQHIAEYGVGGGIVWDSVDLSEFEECAIKAKILTQSLPSFDLLETLLWTPEQGYFLLDLHLQRLYQSALYFAFKLDLDRVRERLTAIATQFNANSYRVRLCVSQPGDIHMDANPIDLKMVSQPVNVGIAQSPIHSSNIFLYHKTTYRTIYEQAKLASPEVDDVLLWNEHGELTESCTANLVVEWNEQWYTPPVHCGLLAGTFRGWLLQQNKLQEKVIRLSDLQHCSRIFLINSVRQIREAQLEFVA
jgi:para-aminobenzoate synthetase/4-amino-4-deoxychorismate lyase